MEGMFNDNISKNDYLGYETYIESFKYIIDSKEKIIQPPVVFGIHGKWGSGKSTFMELLKNKLVSDNKIIISINPWEYEEGTDFVTIFFALLYKEIIEKSFSENFKKNVTKFVRTLLKTVKIKVNTPAYMPISGSAEIDFSKLAEKEQKSILEKAIEDKYLRRDTINNILDDTEIKDKKIIVFIDDLDRCSVDKVINTIESIKLFLSSKNCIFFLGCDLEYLKSAIAIHYKEYIESKFKDNKNDIYKESIDNFTKEYLEKIIQIPFNIPIIDKKNISEFINRMLNLDVANEKIISDPDFKENEFTINIEFLTNIFFMNSASPRRIKRVISLIYLNYVILSYKNLDYINIDFISLLSILSEINSNYFKENFYNLEKALNILEKIEKKVDFKTENLILNEFVNNKEIMDKFDLKKVKERLSDYLFVTEISSSEEFNDLIIEDGDGLSFNEFYSNIKNDDHLRKFITWFFDKWINKSYFKVKIQVNYLEVFKLDGKFVFRIDINKNTSKIELNKKSNTKLSFISDMQKVKSVKGETCEKLKEELERVKQKIMKVEENI